jgi:hypothetical protein
MWYAYWVSQHKEAPMARKTKLLGVTTKRGEKMRQGKGWRLVSQGGTAFKATLIRRFKVGDENVAVFRVLQIPDDSEGTRQKAYSAASTKAWKTRRRNAAQAKRS